MLSGVNFDLWEWLTLPLYIFIIYAVALNHQKNKIEKEPLYRFYTWGVIAHIAGGLFLGIIYQYYYGAGDTFGYFLGAVNMNKLMFVSPLGWLKNEFGSANVINYAYFNDQTGYPYLYMYNDPRTYMVIRFINIIILPAFCSYLLATVVVAWFCYIGMWKMFYVFAKHYPNIQNELAFGILFFPSVLFWGSGILKDAVTLSATGWVAYCIYYVFILKRKRPYYSLILLLNLFLITIIKPYITIALLPGSFLWIFSQRIYSIKNAVARVLILPLAISISALGGYYILSDMGGVMDKFALQKVLTTSVQIQNDLKQSYYQGHSFDIGLKNASPAELLTKSPQALIAGLFRPFIWESGNAVMLLAGLENTAILLLSLYVLFKKRFLIISRLFKEPLLLFAFIYSIFFAFFVGLTTANFGALVRFKIAYLPFLMASLFILFNGVYNATNYRENDLSALNA
jgi:hypothetical protein